jgi:hypothetical protein
MGDMPVGILLGIRITELNRFNEAGRYREALDFMPR